jgi:farnesol dehydrogenase
MKIFLTGATGFLGGQLLSALRQRKHEITALVRSPQKSSFPGDVKVVQGSIENTDSFCPMLKGQDVFVNVAALVKMWMRDRSQFDRVNVEAVGNAIRAASDSGIPKFVHTSSFMALGPSNGKPINEDDGRRVDHLHNDYERTKYLGDQLARKHQDEGYPVKIVYPGVIYGPGNLTDGNIIAKNIIPLLNGKMPFGLSILTWSYAYVADVVQAMLKIIETETPSGRYILGGDNRSGEEFYRDLSEVSGKKPPSMNIPIAMAKMAGFSEYLLAQLFGREPKMLTHEVAEIYKHSWAYDSSRANKELSYQITPLKDGLAAMIEWLRSAGYLK